MPRFQAIGFDADDTLWDNERLYIGAQSRFKELLSKYHSPEWVQARLDETEKRNLAHFGFGIKSFALSMIETAVELTEGRIEGKDIKTLIDMAKEMIAADVQLMEHTANTLAALSKSYQLILITKGDLLDQESKITRSGLAHHFIEVEIVSEKNTSSYARLLMRHNIAPEHFLMVGNSLSSDILPVLELGGSAVYVPYALTWVLETAEPPPEGQAGFYVIDHLGLLPELVARLERENTPA